MKLVHCADMHLDTPFRTGLTAAQAAQRRQEQKETFYRVISEAKDADLLLIAGDLFDGGLVSRDTLHFLRRCFAEIPDTAVFIAAGNHDPYRSGSPYTEMEWGKNVHIFDTRLECVPLEEHNACVYGASFGSPVQYDSQISSLRCDSQKLNFLLLHADLNAGAESPYRPLKEEELENTGADYAALGHVHQYSGMLRAGNTCYAYPGTPEGRGFDETGAKGILKGEIRKGSVELEFLPICKRQYRRIAVDCGAAGDLEQLLAAIRLAVEGTVPERDFYRFILHGRPQNDLHISEEVIRQRLSEQFYFAEVRDETLPAYDLEALAREDTLRGRFTAEILRKISVSPGQEAVLRLALKYGLAAMEGDDARV